MECRRIMRHCTDLERMTSGARRGVVSGAWRASRREAAAHDLRGWSRGCAVAITTCPAEGNECRDTWLTADSEGSNCHFWDAASQSARDRSGRTRCETRLLSGIVSASEVEHYGVGSHEKSCSAVLSQPLCV